MNLLRNVLHTRPPLCFSQALDEMNGKELDGEPIEIVFAKPPDQKRKERKAQRHAAKSHIRGVDDKARAERGATGVQGRSSPARGRGAGHPEAGPTSSQRGGDSCSREARRVRGARGGRGGNVGGKRKADGTTSQIPNVARPIIRNWALNHCSATLQGGDHSGNYSGYKSTTRNFIRILWATVEVNP
uniref:RRM domain-containing protein n=1 Tax=Labrus bergylta TaxID=56723 RepID=A0A3Q3F7V8_9LABR